MATERQLIAAFLRPFPPSKADIGPGDDAAVLSSGKESLCITTDALVEGVHFTKNRFTAKDIGYKALAVNLSDLAAMGARPLWFVCALGLPRNTQKSFVIQVASGMAILARRHRIDLIGGNFTRSRDITLTLTCAGEVPRGRAIRRDRGRPGDILFISGTLGDARAGLAHGAPLRLQQRQKHPEPRLDLGILARDYATAGMDLSDGLARDLTELCRCSGTGARVELARLPTSAALRRAVRGARARAELAWVGGEDYELLLAVPPSRVAAFEHACQRAGQTIARVGELTRGRRIHFLWDEVAIHPPVGFDHFA